MSQLPRDFRLAALRCRWQRLPARLDTLPLAREWLDGLCVDGAGLVRDPRGRPRLPAGAGDIGWSHSAGRLLMVYAHQGTVGVDVEAGVRPIRAMAVARRYFSPGEVEALAAMDGACRQQAFLRMWCSKEAVLKAAGCGIAFGLHRVAFHVDGATPHMTHCDPALGGIADWTIHEVEPESGFFAVIATCE